MRRGVRSVGGGELASAEPLYASASLVVEPSVPAAISLPRGRLKDGSQASASLRTIDMRGTAPTDTVNVYKGRGLGTCSLNVVAALPTVAAFVSGWSGWQNP